MPACYLLFTYSNCILKKKQTTKQKKKKQMMKSIEETWSLECRPPPSLTSKLYHKPHPRQSDLMFNPTGKI